MRDFFDIMKSNIDSKHRIVEQENEYVASFLVPGHNRESLQIRIEEDDIKITSFINDEIKLDEIETEEIFLKVNEEEQEQELIIIEKTDGEEDKNLNEDKTESINLDLNINKDTITMDPELLKRLAKLLENYKKFSILVNNIQGRKYLISSQD